MDLFTAWNAFWGLLKSDDFAKAVATVAAAFTFVQQVRHRKANSRASIKQDLELLALLDKADESHTVVKAHIDAAIRRMYDQRKNGRFTIYHKFEFVLGILLLTVFLAGTVHLIRHGSYWWAIVTGFVAFVGLGAIINGLDSNYNPDE